LTTDGTGAESFNHPSTDQVITLGGRNVADAKFSAWRDVIDCVRSRSNHGGHRAWASSGVELDIVRVSRQRCGPGFGHLRPPGDRLWHG